jgi:hypothetical protein
MRTIQPRVTGAVRLKLFKGDCRVVGRRSPLTVEAEKPSSALRPPPSEDPFTDGASLVRRFAGDPDVDCSRSVRRSGSTSGCSKTT